MEPRAIIKANKVIRKGCIISVGAIADHDTDIGLMPMSNRVIYKNGGIVESKRKLETD